MEKFAAIVVRGMLKFDKQVIKRYMGVETPLYKAWWACHVSYMQQKLNTQRITF